MKTRALFVLAAITASWGWSGTSRSQPRCDCTSIVDTCTANVAVRGSWIEIKTDRPQCARVDYFVDGLPFVSVVVDGEDRQDWIARAGEPRVMVQSCQVCRDTASDRPVASPPAAVAPEAPDATLRPLIAGVPEYPAAARARGVEGYVDVELTVNAQGGVESPRVTAAEPRGVFDAAALAAVSRWRYPAADRPPQTIKERVEFSLDDLIFAGPAERAGGPAAGPRNECVREDVVYNYGEMVDVGLINACREPLLVFGCAPGTGKYLDRWLCNDSETQGDLLLPRDDPRLGARASVSTPEGIRTYGYTDAFVVTRAPNSEYWWIACAAADTSCRADARRWIRAVAGQPANVDPQDRSPIAVARSR
jgi:TonB family protein